MTETPLTCPVCRARWRCSSTCSRCGADLAHLMLLALKAHALREEARSALSRGLAVEALDLVERAEALRGTDRGRCLRLLARWLLEPGS